MAGITFTVSGDQMAALNTIKEVFAAQGYTVTQTGNQSLKAERGSQGGSVLLGAFSGKKGVMYTLMLLTETSMETLA